MFILYCDGDVRNPWMCCIEKILNTCGLSYIWQNHVSNMNVKWLKCVIKQNLQDQAWFSRIKLKFILKCSLKYYVQTQLRFSTKMV